MNAGSDTTDIVLTNVLYYLIKNPPKLATLRREVASVLPSEDIIAPYAKVKNLPYLRACLDESLRISPPVAFSLVRKTPPEGVTILGEFIPGNTVVSVPAYVAHRSHDIFPDPEEFRPERCLEMRKRLRKWENTSSRSARVQEAVSVEISLTLNSVY